jgi:ubiquinone/menaquinone biosynthesis C-methylase UbiE
MGQQSNWTEVFTSVFDAPPSVVQAGVWTQVFGAEYPAELEPHSYVTRTELEVFVNHLDLAAGETLVDAGCGRGGPGLWVAATSGASLLGVDISPTAVADAAQRAIALGLGDRARFTVGAFDALPIETEAVAGLMSVDALLFAPDKAAAVEEFSRVLRPGARLVATTWDYKSQPPGRPPQVADHKPLLIEYGFSVLAYEETIAWEANQRRLDALLLESVEELAAESGEDPDKVRQGIQEMAATVDSMLRRVLIVAQKR